MEDIDSEELRMLNNAAPTAVDADGNIVPVADLDLKVDATDKVSPAGKAF